MENKIVALAGGVGGAKLAYGLSRLLPSSDLSVIVNTGDDFDYLGMRICPDLDTVCYTLAGLANQETGWGQKGDSWQVYKSLVQLGGPDWFHIGDKDIATHLERTRLMAEGYRLSEIVKRFCSVWQIGCNIYPMSDDLVQTRVETVAGEILEFQDYFVKKSWQPILKRIIFTNVEKSRPVPEAVRAINECDFVIICPSNPLVSIDPILAVNGIREAAIRKPVIAVSPIVGNQAIKGPLAKMITELFDVQPSADWVAKYYQQTFRLDGILIDKQDDRLESSLNRQGIICKTTPSIMITEQDRVDLAKEVVAFGQKIIERN